jgi:hypothetical protein
MEHDRLSTAEGAKAPEAATDRGTAPPAQPATSLDPTAPDTPTPDAASARRGMKLVVTLRQDDGGAYRAVLALGADGCDPLLRAADVDDLPAALDEVPALLAEAQARWAEQPRNPAARPARPSRAAANRAPAAAPAPAAVTPAATAAPAAPPTGNRPPAATAAQPAGPGQLTLFG